MSKTLLIDRQKILYYYRKTVSYYFYTIYQELNLMSPETQEVERKIQAILKILNESKQPLGARIVASRLREYGIELGERAVRYHLKSMDELGLTQLLGRDGRFITEYGKKELGDALVRDKVGFAINRIELLAFRTNFDYKSSRGQVPVNISFFKESDFSKAVKKMKPVFDAGLCVSKKVAVAREKQQIGEVTVPDGYIGLATVCSVVMNGVLLKSGIPMDSRFGGILQIKDGRPLRFVEIIQYDGSSLDPSEIFIRARMTTVSDVIKTGNGKILANFREIPSICRPVAEKTISRVKETGINGLLLMGRVSESICELPLGLNRVGMVLYGGLNPVAAAEEAGIEVRNFALSTLIEYRDLVDFDSLSG
jgi:repressor of nif and glnA expression